MSEVYYVDDFGGKIPESWLGVGGSPDDCWNRVEVEAPPWGKNHEWREDSSGWIFVERLEGGGEIHCPTEREGVFPDLSAWEATVASHEVDSIEPLPRPCPCGAMTALDCAGECGAT